MNPSGRLMGPGGTWFTAAIRGHWPCKHARHHQLVFSLQMTFEMQSKWSSLSRLLPDLHLAYTFPKEYTQERFTHTQRIVIEYPEPELPFTQPLCSPVLSLILSITICRQERWSSVHLPKARWPMGSLCRLTPRHPLSDSSTHPKVSR